MFEIIGLNLNRRNQWFEHVLQDNFHISGAWGDRHVILFTKAFVIAKKQKDGNLHAKVVIRVNYELFAFLCID